MEDTRARDAARCLARCAAILALVPLAASCQAGSRDAPTPAPHVTPGDSPFEDTWDLMRAIEARDFAERAGIRDELREARAAERALPDALRIPFTTGTAVPESERERLEAFASELAEDPRVALRVVGCSDPSGSAALNLRISRQRAEEVALSLQRLGVDEERFVEVIGRGEDCPEPERAVRVEPTREGEGAQRPG